MPVASASFLIFAASLVGTPGPAIMAIKARRAMPLVTGEKYLMWRLAALTAVGILYMLFTGAVA